MEVTQVRSQKKIPQSDIRSDTLFIVAPMMDSDTESLDIRRLQKAEEDDLDGDLIRSKVPRHSLVDREIVRPSQVPEADWSEILPRTRIS